MYSVGYTSESHDCHDCGKILTVWRDNWVYMDNWVYSHFQNYTTTNTSGSLGAQMTFNWPTTPTPPPVATTVSIMADGMLLVDAGAFGKLRVPPHLFKDLVTLAEMGLIEKLAPETIDRSE